MVILSAETGIGTASTTCTVTEHLLKEVREASGIAARKLLPVGRIPVSASVRAESGTGTAKPGSAESSIASRTRLLPCPLLRFKFISMFPVLAIFIIFLPFFRITQHLIRLIDSLKLILSRRVIRIQVRMMLTRQFAERLLNVILRCRFVHSKDLIIINISHSL